MAEVAAPPSPVFPAVATAEPANIAIVPAAMSTFRIRLLVLSGTYRLPELSPNRMKTEPIVADVGLPATKVARLKPLPATVRIDLLINISAVHGVCGGSAGRTRRRLQRRLCGGSRHWL